MANSGHIVVDLVGADEGRELPPVSPPVPYALCFTDLSYSVKKRQPGLRGCLPSRASNRLASSDALPSNRKALLDGVSGEARIGRASCRERVCQYV